MPADGRTDDLNPGARHRLASIARTSACDIRTSACDIAAGALSSTISTTGSAKLRLFPFFCFTDGGVETVESSASVSVPLFALGGGGGGGSEGLSAALSNIAASRSVASPLSIGFAPLDCRCGWWSPSSR